MDWLNYHHFLYFWVVAREQSIARAAERLGLTPSTVSLQVRAFERALGEDLFSRSGRRLALTDAGRLAFRYAEEIFSTGQEFLDVLQGRPTQRPIRFVVGTAGALTKLVAFRLLEPALALSRPLRIVCVQDTAESLTARLAQDRIDLVLADGPVAPGTRVRAFSHLLGESGITFFAAARPAARYRKGFPRSLDGAPLLLPTEGSMLRRSIDQWLGAVGVRPVVAGEFDDAALLKVFGEAGVGVFPVPTVIEREMARQYGGAIVGRTDAARERYYAISLERRLTHPAVVAICEAARKHLFGRRPARAGGKRRKGARRGA
jgi:LysR family transcriptional activator of nhaA